MTLHETIFTPKDIANLRDACNTGCSPMGEAAGIDSYVMRKLDAEILGRVPLGHALHMTVTRDENGMYATHIEVKIVKGD